MFKTKDQLLKEADELALRTDLTDAQKWNISKSISIQLRNLEKYTSHLRVVVENVEGKETQVIIVPVSEDWLMRHPKATDVKKKLESELSANIRYVTHQVDANKATFLNLNFK